MSITTTTTKDMKMQQQHAEKLIIRSEKVGLIDILSLLLLRRSITSYSFVETGDKTALELANVRADWLVAITEAIQKFLAGIYLPAKWLGIFVEFFLNLFVLNGGLLGLLWNLFRCKLVIPNREAANFRSMIGMIDGRTELKAVAGDVSLKYLFAITGNKLMADDKQPLLMQRLRAPSIVDVTMMSAKIAYENAAYIKNVVNNVWKYHFVGFYSCWNKFIGSDTTQAFVMVDKATDASFILVAFRGTEPFNMQDWSTDVNLSWLGMGDMGHVHVGFLKALGLQEEDEKDVKRAFPKDVPNDAQNKPIAYYTLRTVLRSLLKNHPNAKIIVTGHSLGGALAAIFPALLALHSEADILKALVSIQTYGQPRVGDAKFVGFLRQKVPCQYLRIVYRYDIVPRIPFDIPLIADFRHGGVCVYFDGWYKGTIMEGDAPNKNYFDPRFMLSMYKEAWGDLFKGMFLWMKEGKDYREGLVSILYRASGLVFPGIASHSPRDYVNSVRLGKVAPKEV